ncbi:hypothetical protein [Polaromonas sp.]
MKSAPIDIQAIGASLLQTKPWLNKAGPKQGSDKQDKRSLVLLEPQDFDQ